MPPTWSPGVAFAGTCTETGRITRPAPATVRAGTVRVMRSEPSDTQAPASTGIWSAGRRLKPPLDVFSASVA